MTYKIVASWWADDYALHLCPLLVPRSRYPEALQQLIFRVWLSGQTFRTIRPKVPLVEKPIAAFLQAGAAYMFFAAGFFGGDAVLLLAPAVVSGVAGLALWGRAHRQKNTQPAVNAAVPDPRLDQVQETLASLQSDITHLREDREFMRNLYAGNKATHP